MYKSRLILLLLLIAPLASAGDLSDPAFRQQVAEQFPGVETGHITPSELPGYWQISQGGVVGYISSDGRYLIDGDAIDLKTDRNLTEQARNQWRLTQLATLDDDGFITFAPDRPSATVTVFTDVDCRYCRLLHSHIDEFLAAGVAVRYAFFPLSGPGSESFDKAQAVWCSKDRRKAMTRAKQGKTLKTSGDCKNPVADQFEVAARKLRIMGTPALITADGSFLQMAPPVSRVIEQIKAHQPGS
jgi:thiol:disulfide interchange protein DsbC